MTSKASLWGDSLTFGYAPFLNSTTHEGVNNYGVPNESSTQIKNRMVASEEVYRIMPAAIWAGRNNITAPNTIKADIAAMVAAQVNQNYIVFSISPSAPAGEGSNGINYARLVTLNNDLAAAYPGHYFDVKAYLQGFGDGGAQDNADIALDLIPSSLMTADLLHPNSAGNMLIAARVKTLLSLP